MGQIDNHTPGPWKHRPEKYDDWGMVRAADGMPVATAGVSARCTRKLEDFDPDTNSYREPPEVAANARLIAAAPDLLEACRGLLSIVSDSRGVDGYHRNGEVAEWDEFPEIDVARDAIAKATGEER